MIQMILGFLPFTKYLTSWKMWVLVSTFISICGAFVYIQSLQNKALGWENSYNEAALDYQKKESIWILNESTLKAAISKQNASVNQMESQLQFANEAAKQSAVKLNTITSNYEAHISMIAAMPVPEGCEASVAYLVNGIQDIKWLN